MEDKYDRFYNFLIFKLSVLFFGSTLGSLEVYQNIIGHLFNDLGITEYFIDLQKDNDIKRNSQ